MTASATVQFPAKTSTTVSPLFHESASPGTNLPPPATPGTMPAIECATLFEKRELREPYQRQYQGQTRYTLSMEELNEYLAVMGIEFLCIPQQLGAPFINVDWDEATYPGATGRMISLGFEDLYPGSGWSEGFILYSTYDFSVGAEYDRFATHEDREALIQGSVPDMIEVDGVKGFIRFYEGGYAESPRVYKTYVFPFETSYIAVVHFLGVYNSEDASAFIEKIKTEGYPAELLPSAQAIDFMARTLQFKALP